MKFNDLYKKLFEKKKKKGTHWWADHVFRRSDEAKQDLGKVLHHTLTESYEVDTYDVRWSDGTIEKGIPAHMVNTHVLKEHIHTKKKKGKKWHIQKQHNMKN